MEVKKVEVLNTDLPLAGLGYGKRVETQAPDVQKAAHSSDSVAKDLEKNEKLLKSQLDQLKKSKKMPNELKKLLEKVNKKLDPFDKVLKVEIDKELHIPVFKIIDKDTHQVIRQVPWEEVLKFLRNLFKLLQQEQLKQEDLKGLFFKKEV